MGFLLHFNNFFRNFADMRNDNIKDMTLEMACHWGHAEYMEEGLILTDSIHGEPVGEPIRTNFIILALCCKGMASYTLDTRKINVKAGDMLFISNRHIMDNYETSSDFECLSIIVSTPFYHGFVQNVKNVSTTLLFSMKNPVVPLLPGEIASFTNYYQYIRKKMEDKKHHCRKDLVKALLLAMFYDMSNVIWRVERSTSGGNLRAETIFTKFIQLLEKNFRVERRVGWYAKQLNITPKYLSETIKKASKQTPNDWIDSYVMLELRVMLANSTLNIKEITKAMNFANQSFLGKYFKEHMGISPSEFRKGQQPRKVRRTKTDQSDE